MSAAPRGHARRLLTVCSSDSTAARALGTAVGPTGGVTIESCTAACQAAGFPLAGAEYADECYCGSAFANGAAPAALADCNMPCAANASEFCGGPDRLNVRPPSRRVVRSLISRRRTTTRAPSPRRRPRRPRRAEAGAGTWVL